jgi:hypothetical protein
VGDAGTTVPSDFLGTSNASGAATLDQGDQEDQLDQEDHVDHVDHGDQRPRGVRTEIPLGQGSNELFAFLGIIKNSPRAGAATVARPFVALVGPFGIRSG